MKLIFNLNKASIVIIQIKGGRAKPNKKENKENNKLQEDLILAQTHLFNRMKL